MNKKDKDIKSILVLPRWYPNKTDIQLGIFIQRQIALMRNEFRFHVVYVQALPVLKDKYQLVTSSARGFNEHIIYFRSAKGPLRKLINFYRYKKAQQLGISKVSDSIDLCHVHVPYRSAIGALKLLKENNIPFVITEHWSGHLNGLYLKKNSLDKWLYKRTLNKAVKISTVSEPLRKAFEANTGFNTTVIPNYIEKHKVKPDTTKQNKTALLSVGDFDDKTKNFSGLLKAYRQVLETQPNIELTLIGGGPDETAIKQLAEALNFPNGTLIFTGRKEHEYVLNAMQKCDFYICNSRYETFGMTVAEALYAGKPVISTLCGGPETFLNPGNSITISTAPCKQIEAQPELVNAIMEMLERYTSFNSTEISTAIDQQFGTEAVKEKWIRFYTI